jgi:hypothetical protein
LPLTRHEPNGLTNLIEKLGELAQKGEELQGLTEFGKDELKGVYGFKIRPVSEGRMEARECRSMCVPTHDCGAQGGAWMTWLTGRS